MRSRSGTIGFDLNALRAFTLVVAYGGMTEAARRSGLPKSTLSRQVGELEAAIGERLLERRGRGLAPTQVGRRLYESSRTSVETLEALRHDLLAALLAGRVKVASPVMLARGPLQDVVAAFLTRHPAIEIELVVSDRFTAADAHDADVTFCVAIASDRRKLRHSVGFAEARLYAAPSLIDASAPIASPADLARLPVLAQGCAPGERQGWSLQDPAGGMHRVGFLPRLVAADPDMLLAAALAGCGMCRMPTFLVEPHLRTGRLVPVLAGHVAERHEVTVATSAETRSAAARHFASEAAEGLRARLSQGARGSGVEMAERPPLP